MSKSYEKLVGAKDKLKELDQKGTDMSKLDLRKDNKEVKEEAKEMPKKNEEVLKEKTETPEDRGVEQEGQEQQDTDHVDKKAPTTEEVAEDTQDTNEVQETVAEEPVKKQEVPVTTPEPEVKKEQQAPQASPAAIDINVNFKPHFGVAQADDGVPEVTIENTDAPAVKHGDEKEKEKAVEEPKEVEAPTVKDDVVETKEEPASEPKSVTAVADTVETVGGNTVVNNISDERKASLAEENKEQGEDNDKPVDTTALISQLLDNAREGYKEVAVRGTVDEKTKYYHAMKELRNNPLSEDSIRTIKEISDRLAD